MIYNQVVTWTAIAILALFDIYVPPLTNQNAIKMTARTVREYISKSQSCFGILNIFPPHQLIINYQDVGGETLDYFIKI